jgi:hypothetical protein
MKEVTQLSTSPIGADQQGDCVSASAIASYRDMVGVTTELHTTLSDAASAWCKKKKDKNSKKE